MNRLRKNERSMTIETLKTKDTVNMKTNPFSLWKWNGVALAVALGGLAAPNAIQATHVPHAIVGITGTAFTLTAKSGYISTSDGNNIYFWGFANGAGPVQYPGPTLIVNQGATITVTLNNELPVPVSILFPGQGAVTTSGGVAGALTREAAPAGSVTYTFTASQAGTYLYNSGTQPDLQVEMGLVGALIVRPSGFNLADTATWRAYAHDDARYNHEFLFLLTEMDENIHDQVELAVQSGQPIAVDTTRWWPVYWFINGRTGPDTVLAPNSPWLPHQPYDALALFQAGEKVLMRVIGAGRDPHPFHHHGNHSRVIARDGRLLESAAGVGADLSQMVFTISSFPGGTHDAIFSWTGEKLGWDVYGHKPGDPKATNALGQVLEYEPDHGKPFPVILPPDQNLTFGQMYGGSPFLGSPGILPPGEGGFNPNNGFMYMWHSHSEKELVNNNLFPGGMLTFALIEAPTTQP